MGKISILFIDGTSEVKTFPSKCREDDMDRANKFIFDYIHDEKNKVVKRFDVALSDYSWSYSPTYPKGWGDNTKLDVYTSYCVFYDYDGFLERNIIDEVDTKKEAVEICKDRGCELVMVCCSAMFDNDLNKASMFGYGRTKTEARRDLARQAKEYGYTLKRGYNN